MKNTKENILLTALTLFAQDGYEAVSVSRITGALGMTKGALYKHYQNKRDIFESILAWMEQQDAEHARACALPEAPRSEDDAAYRRAAPEQLAAFTLAQFRYWTEEEFPAAFRRMLTVEQFRSAEMAALYQQYLAAGPLGYVTDLFDAWGLPDAAQRAAEFYAPMFLFYSLYDGAADPAAVTRDFERLLGRLCAAFSAG